MPTPSRSRTLQTPPVVKADSVRRDAARRILAACGAVALVAGCGGGQADSTHGADAVRGVKAHFLADEPSRNHAPASAHGFPASAEPRRGDFGSHPVAVKELRVARDGLYGALYAPADVHARASAVFALRGSAGGVEMRGYARAPSSHWDSAVAPSYLTEARLPRRL